MYRQIVLFVLKKILHQQQWQQWFVLVYFSRTLLKKWGQNANISKIILIFAASLG